MTYLFDILTTAVRLLFSTDREVLNIVVLSISMACTSTLLATLFGIPAGFVIGISNFRWKPVLTTVINTLTALPTVVIGLMFYSLLSRQGPLGSLEVLFTPWAIILGQTVLAFPIITGISLAAVQSVDPRVQRTARALGGNRFQVTFTILREARFSILAAIIAGFGRVFSEVGISMMLGGNIRGYTRNITTAIALESGKGEIALGFALGIVLLAVAFAVNIVFHRLQRTGKQK